MTKLKKEYETYISEGSMYDVKALHATLSRLIEEGHGNKLIILSRDGIHSSPLGDVDEECNYAPAETWYGDCYAPEDLIDYPEVVAEGQILQCIYLHHI